MLRAAANPQGGHVGAGATASALRRRSKRGAHEISWSSSVLQALMAAHTRCFHLRCERRAADSSLANPSVRHRCVKQCLRGSPMTQALILGREVAEVYAEAITLLRRLEASPVDAEKLVGLDPAGLYQLSKVRACRRVSFLPRS